MYYTLRELSSHASELPLLPPLGGNVLVRSGGGSGGTGGPKAKSKGKDWLAAHLPAGSFTPAWVTGMRGDEAPHGDEACQAVAINGSGAWVEHFVAGAAHLVRCSGVSGFYMDGIAFNRDAMKRMRRAAEAAHSGLPVRRRPLHFDNHPNNKVRARRHPPPSCPPQHVRLGFQPVSLARQTSVYIEMLPYFDSIWVGELSDYSQGARGLVWDVWVPVWMRRRESRRNSRGGGRGWGAAESFVEM